MGNFWFWLIFWVLVAIILTGVILFIVGLEAPHKDKPHNTVNYESLKWIGVGLLIFGGVGMLIWLYVKFRGNKSKTIESSVMQEPLLNTSSSDGLSNTVNSYQTFDLNSCGKAFGYLNELSQLGDNNARNLLTQISDYKNSLLAKGYSDSPKLAAYLCNVFKNVLQPYANY